MTTTANPVVTEEREELSRAQQVLSWGQRAIKQGLRLGGHGEPNDLRPYIDCPERMQRLVRYIQAGVPDMCTAVQVRSSFEEPESHAKAREILGERNFHGVVAAQTRFGAYSEEELMARQTIPFSEETLRECAKDFFLCATHPLDLLGVQSAFPERFTADVGGSWFGREEQRRLWSSVTLTHPWLLIRKGPVPASGKKLSKVQEEHMKHFPKERLLLPVEFVYGALLHVLETGERICEGYVIRFAVQSAEGNKVHVYWCSGKLRLSIWGDSTGSNLISASARDS